MEMLRDAVTIFGRYVKGQFTIAAMLAVVYAIGFAVIHLPGWPIVALLCGALNVIPYFGSLAGLVIAAAVALFSQGGLQTVLGVLVVFVIAQVLETFVLTPKILGKSLSLHPLIVFLSMLVGGALFGFFGLLFAVPVAAILVHLLKRPPRRV